MKSEIRFGAPWSRSVNITTLVVIALLLTLAAMSCFSMPDKIPFAARLLVAIVPPAVLAFTTPFMVRGYVLMEGELLIKRIGWQNRIPLTEVVSAAIDPEAMRRSIRICGSGGLFGFFGWFRNGKLGVYRAYCTDLKRCVVLKLQCRTIVVTPDNPAEFVAQLNVRLDALKIQRA